MHQCCPDKCPFCSGESRILFVKNDLPIRECHSCKHRFCGSKEKVDSRISDQFGDDYFFGGSSCYDNYSEMASDLKRKGIRYGQLLERNLSPGNHQHPSVLDIGAAAGYLMQGFQESGWQATGIEANQTMATIGRQKHGLDVHHCTVEEFRSENLFHAVSMVQVLPHLVRPGKALDGIHENLLPDGLLLIETWSCRSLTARAFGKFWHQYNPPNILHWFSRRSLANLLHKHHFQIIKTGRPSKWINVANATAALRNSLGNSAVARTLTAPGHLLPSGLRVPYPLDDVFWMLARKKSSSNGYRSQPRVA